MALGHLGPIEGQQVIVGEDLDAVVVPEGRDQGARLFTGKAEATKPIINPLHVDYVGVWCLLLKWGNAGKL